MKNWLKALFSEALFSVWWILSALSTLSTFFLTTWAGRPRLVSAISTVVGFAWANLRVFQRQQKEIVLLKANLSSHEARVSELTITPDEGSRYILAPVADIRHGDFRGGYFEFHLMVENTGRRDSTVNNYRVEIIELHQDFPNLKPIEGQNGINGRHCHHGMQSGSILCTTGNIRIPAENATNRGTLLFFIPAIDLQQFVAADLQMQGEERRFGFLHCRLTLTDMTKSSASCEFQLYEA